MKPKLHGIRSQFKIKYFLAKKKRVNISMLTYTCYKNAKIFSGIIDFIYLFIDKFELSNDCLHNAILGTRHKKEEGGNTVLTFLPLIWKMS